MVSRHAEGRPGRDRVDRQAQAVGAVRAAVHQVAEKDQPSAVRMRDPKAPARRLLPALHDIAESAQQRDRLVEAAMQVADDVERPAVLAAVGPQPPAFDHDRVGLLRRAEAVFAEKPLAAQRMAQRITQQLALVPYDAPADGAAGALLADRCGDVEGQRHRHRVVLTSDGDELPAVFGVQVGGVHHRKAARGQPLADQVSVGRQHLGGREVRARERRLARLGGAGQHHQTEVGDGHPHRRARVRPRFRGR